MKKFLSLILMFTFLFSLCVISVSAEDNTFTIDKAYTLYREALKRFSIFQGEGLYDDVNLHDEEFWLWDGNKQCIAYDKAEWVLYHTSSDGKAYNNENGFCYAPFFTVPDFPSDFKTAASYDTVDKNFNYVFKSIDEVKNYFSEVFTDAMVEKNMYVHVIFEIEADKVEMFRYSENNELLLYKTTAVGDSLISFACPYGPISLKVTANKAILMVDFYAYGHDSYPESVEFVKENGTWKVSGGTVFGYLQGYNLANTLNYNPNTGDTASYTIPALTVTALISVALPVGIMRKRRRSA